MPQTSFYIYSDASFIKKHALGVAGFLMFTNAEEHQKNLFSAAMMKTKTFQEKNNIRMELKSAIWALETFKKEVQSLHKKDRDKGMEINLYTDCKSIPGLLQRRKRLESSDFISKRNQRPLSNTDLYKRFYKIFDYLHPNIFWVKGHAPSSKQSWVQKNFSFVDKTVRSKLRSTLSKLTSE